MKTEKRTNAFTIAELIVVIAILAVLSVVGFFSLSWYTEDARTASADMNTRSLYSLIASETAITGNSPRYYVVHDSSAALAWAVTFVDWTQNALTGGAWDEAWTNYSAWNPDYGKLKIDPNKFKTSFLEYLNDASAAYDPKSFSVWAADLFQTAANGAKRRASFFQVAAVSADTGNVSVEWNYPTPVPGSAAGLIKSPVSNEALVDSVRTSAYSSLSDVAASPNSTAVRGTCPSWFVSIPNSSSFVIGGSVARKGWCVAKWEVSPFSTGGWLRDETYSNWKCSAATDDSLNPCGGNEAKKITSKPGEYPIANVSRGEAEFACENQLVDQAGKPLSGGRLPSIALWKAIADDLVAQSVNWSWNASWAGNMSRGCSKWAAAAYSYDNGCVWSGASRTYADNENAGTTVSNPAGANSSPDAYYDKRVWKMSNGSVIHDFAGNLWEYLYETHSNESKAWTPYASFQDGFPKFGDVSLKPWANRNWWQTEWVGWIMFSDTSGGIIAPWTAYSIHSGGWPGGVANSWVASLRFNSLPATSYRLYTTGFRCVVPAQ